MNRLPEWMTTQNTPQERRYYLRCHDCLATTCIDLASPRADLKCGICGGMMIVMGVVTGNKWQHHAEVCTCNEQCQLATGPKCTCSCGGENHGGGYRYYTYVDAQGTINVTAEDSTDKRLEIANEFREYASSAMGRITSLPYYNDYRVGNWIGDKEAWWKIHQALDLYYKAVNGTNHKSRIGKLAKIAA